MRVRFRVRNRVRVRVRIRIRVRDRVSIRDEYANGAVRVLRHLHCAEYRKPRIICP